VTKTHTRAPLVLCALLFACKDKPASPQHGPEIELFVDDTARTVAIDEPIALSKVVAPLPASWLEVRADGTNDHFIELSPRPEDELRLYIDHGEVSIGVFPPITADMPAEVKQRAAQPLSSLVGIKTVHVVTHLPKLPSLIVSVDDREVTLDDALRGLTPSGKRRAQGWALSDVLVLAGAGDAQVVRVIGPRPQEITLDRSEIDKAIIKPNQRGEYVVRVWDEGAKAPTREVRGVTKILVGGS
jgi:hypothetical protein